MSVPCRKCGERIYGPADNHECAAGWDIWRPEHGETREHAVVVHAYDEEMAVQEWAERDDAHGDYTIVSGSDAKVHVAPHGDETTPARVFVVRGESEPTYYANEVPS